MAVSRLNRARLSRNDEEFLVQICHALKDVGASDDEIDKAIPSITTAILANRKASMLRTFLFVFGTCVLLPLIIYGPIVFIAMSTVTFTFVNQHTISAVTALFMSLILLMATGQYLIGPNILRPSINTGYVMGIVIALICTATTIFFGFELWRARYMYLEATSIWDIVIIILLSVWMFSLINITMRWLRLGRSRIFAILRPECALIISLCEAFLALRNEVLWRDQDYRNHIASHLATSADAIERFMPRGIVKEAGASSMAAVRQRFKEAAIPLRRRIVWLATPGPLTRTDLEAELRQAVIAASLGELARLEDLPDRTETIQLERRPWWAVFADLCRGVAWALIPLGLVRLGSALQLPLLSEPDQQATAQKAAYIWLALAILRGLSPGNFKETIDAAGTLLGRSKPKGTE